MRPAPHQTGDIVAGRYDAVSGEMRSDHMISRSGWMGSIAQLLGIFAVLQGILIFFGMPEVLMPLRVRLGR